MFIDSCARYITSVFHSYFAVYILPPRPAYFNGKTSFVSYRQLKDNRRSMKFAMQFRAENENGVLLYSQGPKGIRDYFMVALENRKIVVRYVDDQ